MEGENALKIARIEGELSAMEAKMEAPESRIDAGLAKLRPEMAKIDAEAAKRETRLLLAMAGPIAAGIAILGFVIRARNWLDSAIKCLPRAHARFEFCAGNRPQCGQIGQKLSEYWRSNVLGSIGET